MEIIVGGVTLNGILKCKVMNMVVRKFLNEQKALGTVT